MHTKDVGEYLIFRLRAAGYHGPHLFKDASIKKLSIASEGLVRRVNILADKALLAAFADNVYQVTPRHVDAAIQDSEFGVRPQWRNWRRFGFRQVDWSQPYVFWLGLSAAILTTAVLAAVLFNKWPTSKPIISGDQDIKKQVIQKSAAPSAALSANKPEQATLTINAQQLFVNQRLEATKQLLLNANPETILLQIKSVASMLSAADPERDRLLKTELEMLGQQLEMDNIYLYRMHQGSGIYTVILYGAYAQRADALKALHALPMKVKNNQPYLRTLAGVKKDIEYAATHQAS